PNQVSRRSEPTYKRVHGFETEAAVRLLHSARLRGKTAAAFLAIFHVVFDLAFGLAFGQRTAQAHALDAGGSEHFLLDEFVIGHGADLLDNAAEHAVAEVGVRVTRTGFEIVRATKHVSDYLLLHGGG